MTARLIELALYLVVGAVAFVLAYGAMHLLYRVVGL